MIKLFQTPKYFLLLLVVVCSYGCRPELPTLTDFDRESWINDQKGCSGERIVQLENLKKQKNILLERTQNEVQTLLGQPDEHELHERTRKFFYYYLEPSNNCDSTLSKPARILQIRFSAMGISNEIFVKNE